MKQGRASVSGNYDRKVEPNSRAKDPAAAANIGTAKGDHATDVGDFTRKSAALDVGRGYSAPSIGTRTNPKGSQGKY